MGTYNKLVNLESFFKYSFYDEQGNNVVILDDKKLKEFFDADIVAFNEKNM